MNRKKTVLNLGIVLMLTAAVLFWLLRDDFNATISVIKTSNPRYLLCAAAAFGVTLLTSAWILLNWVRLFNPHFKFKYAFQSNLLAVFARHVTPMQSGGQAMNAYVLAEHGIKVETSVFILSIDFVVSQTAQVIFSLFWVLTVLPSMQSRPILFWGVLLGFIVNSSILVILYLLVTSKKLHRFISKYGVKFLARFNLVKHPEAVMLKAEEKIEVFSQSLIYLKNHKQVVIKNILMGVIGLMFMHSIPFLLAQSLHVTLSLNDYFIFVALSVFVSIYNALLPMPGGTGGLESVFMMMYGSFISEHSRQRAFMILWRFVTYYIIVVCGAIYFMIFVGKKNAMEDSRR